MGAGHMGVTIFTLSSAWTVGDSCPEQLGCVNRVEANVGQLGTLDTSSATCLACTLPTGQLGTFVRTTLLKSTCEAKTL
jgi:hypothetical protein